MVLTKLPREFYLQDTVAAAKACLGKILVRETSEGRMSGRIIEAEAYLRDDPACHACRGMTRRNAAMFGEPGHAYVYFTYGFHYCLNFVTQPKGIGEAVLIRAIQPLEGLEIMRRNRGRDDPRELCSGPGKLAQALQIDKSLNGIDLLGDVLYVLDDGFDVGEVVSRERIGIKEATDKLWRFYPAAFQAWVSKK